MLFEKRRIHIDNKNAPELLYPIISKDILSLGFNNHRELIILCIGTDRSTGDSLGPLTGTLLSKYDTLPAIIIGNIHSPVHASNLEEIINAIENKYRDPFIIAVDAGLGKQNSVGYIDVKKAPETGDRC